MKDVISILQSRIAKRENKIRYYTQKMKIVANVFDSEFKEYEFQLAGENSPLVVGLAKEQKQDKRILAEIVQLRRELKERDITLDRFYRAEEI